VPEKFRATVEDSEPLFSRLRNFDAFRFRYDPWLRGTYQAADKILLTAPYMLDILPTEYHNKVEFVAETAIDSEAFSDDPVDRSNDSEIVLLYVGRITPYKGLEFLLRALAMLPAHVTEKTRVEIVGSGEDKYEQLCRQIVAQADLSHRVTFCGRRSKAEVLDHYRSADIFCFPTLAETTGNVLLEAMAMGLPIVSTNYGGPAAVVHPDAGILVEPDSPDSFSSGIAGALENLITNENLRRSMGEKARQHVIENLSWNAKGNQIADIYERLLKESEFN